MAIRSPHAAVIGTSVSGFAAALALARDGYTITCIERDATPMPRDHLDALRALFCHANLLDLSHALFARADLLNKLLACYEKNKDEDLTQRPIRGEMLELFATAS